MSEASHTSSSTGVKTKEIDSKEDEEPLETESATEFRGREATMNFLSIDWSHVQYVENEIRTNRPPHWDAGRDLRKQRDI